MVNLSNELQPAGRIPAVNEIVYTLDLNGYFKFVNAAGQLLSGYTGEEARRMHVAEVLAPELADFVRQWISETIAQQVGAVYEIEIITKDHRRIALETSIHVVLRDGRPVEIQGIALPPVRASGNGRPRCLDANFLFGAVSPTC